MTLDGSSAASDARNVEGPSRGRQSQNGGRMPTGSPPPPRRRLRIPHHPSQLSQRRVSGLAEEEEEEEGETENASLSDLILEAISMRSVLASAPTKANHKRCCRLKWTADGKTFLKRHHWRLRELFGKERKAELCFLLFRRYFRVSRLSFVRRQPNVHRRVAVVPKLNRGHRGPVTARL